MSFNILILFFLTFFNKEEHVNVQNNEKTYYFDTLYKFVDVNTKSECVILINSKDSTYMLRAHDVNNEPALAYLIDRKSDYNYVFTFSETLDFSYISEGESKKKRPSILFDIEEKNEIVDDNNFIVETKFNYKKKRKNNFFVSTLIAYEKSENFNVNSTMLDFFSHGGYSYSNVKVPKNCFPKTIVSEFSDKKVLLYKLKLKQKIEKKIIFKP